MSRHTFYGISRPLAKALLNKDTVILRPRQADTLIEPIPVYRASFVASRLLFRRFNKQLYTVYQVWLVVHVTLNKIALT